MMLIAVLMSVIFTWLPGVFSFQLALFDKYINKHVIMLFGISLVFLALNALYLSVQLGPVIYYMNSFLHSLQRL